MGRPTNKERVKRLERQLQKISRRLDRVDVNTAEEHKLLWDADDIERKIEQIEEKLPPLKKTLTGRALFQY